MNNLIKYYQLSLVNFNNTTENFFYDKLIISDYSKINEDGLLLLNSDTSYVLNKLNKEALNNNYIEYIHPDTYNKYIDKLTINEFLNYYYSDTFIKELNLEKTFILNKPFYVYMFLKNINIFNYNLISREMKVILFNNKLVFEYLKFFEDHDYKLKSSNDLQYFNTVLDYEFYLFINKFKKKAEENYIYFQYFISNKKDFKLIV